MREKAAYFISIFHNCVGSICMRKPFEMKWQPQQTAEIQDSPLKIMEQLSMMSWEHGSKQTDREGVTFSSPLRLKKISDTTSFPTINQNWRRRLLEEKRGSNQQNTQFSKKPVQIKRSFHLILSMYLC